MSNTLAAVDDERLVEAIAERSESALAELYRRYAGSVWTVARRLVGDPRSAEDVVQDVFIRVWDRPAAYDPARGSLRTFLLVQARSRSIDLLRSEHARRLRERANEPQGRTSTRGAPDAEFAHHSEVDEVLRAVGVLSDEQRQAIELAFFNGLTYRQIAKVLDLPEGTVKGRIRLGLQRLRLEMSDP